MALDDEQARCHAQAGQTGPWPSAFLLALIVNSLDLMYCAGACG